MGFYHKAVLVFSAAVLQILSFPPFNFYWLSFVFAIPLFIFLKKEHRLFYILTGFFIYRILAGLGIVYFVFDPFMFFISALIFLGLPLSFYFIAKLKKKFAFLSLLILWPFWDQMTAQFTALPSFIMVAGNALGQSPFLGLASIGGLTSLTVFVIFINLFIFFVFYYWKPNEKRVIISAIGLTLVLLASWQVSQFLLKQNENRYLFRQNIKKIALVSDNGYLDKVFKNPNLDLSKLDQEIDKALLPLLKDLKSKEFDIVILPEAMIDVDYGNNEILIAKYSEFADELNKNLVANAITVQNGKRYNSLLFFNEKGEFLDIFNKKYLTIVGEYWPFGDWRPFYFDWLLEKSSQKERYKNYVIFNPSKSFARGETKIVHAGELIFAPAICLEIHYPYEMKKRVDMNANVIFNTSSNMWIPFGLEHYLRLTDNLRRIQAVWLKIPIVVNGRKEPPAIIIPNGERISSYFETENKNYNILIVEVRI